VPLPYYEAKEIPLGRLSIAPFGILVSSAVLIGSFLAVRRAVQRGLPRARMESLASYILITGFVLSHVLDVLMYRPRDALRNPLELLMLWKGISSYGGFIGCAVGVFLWSRLKKEPILPYGDQVSAVFPVAWILGRAGCATAHDHIGKLSNSPLAIAFPDGTFAPAPDGARFDLGLIEMLLTIPLALFMLWYSRKPRRAGAITGMLCMLYAPMRFPLDALRATDISNPDARYAGMTPAQWLSLGLFFLGAYLFTRSRRQAMVGA
jgi:phosphatidylglycerol:prolipoprotein diacylglycerol transferase